MTRTRFTLAILLALALSADACAQFFPPVINVPVIARDGIGFHIGGRRLSIDAFIPFGPPYPAIVPVSPTRRGFRQVAPAYLPFGYYPYGYGFGYPLAPYGSIDQSISVTIINPPALPPSRLSLAPSNREEYDLSGIDLDVEPPSKIWGKKPGLARVADAKGGGQKQELAANPGKPPAAAPPPAKEELTDGERFMRAGIAAFRAGEFGLALRRFRQADSAVPPVRVAEFYQGQAYMAMGKFRQAADVLQQALQREPDWVSRAFRPRRDLYGDEAAWKEHRGRLEKALAANPKDADLLFLLGYIAWFNGERGAAVDYFTRSRELAANPRWCDLFLRVAMK